MRADPYVVVVGGMNLDIQGKSLSPFRAGDSNPGGSSLCAGGVGRNIAENLARLGARVELVSVVGDDGLAPLLLDSCSSLGIGLEGLLRLEREASPRYICLLDSDGSLVGAVASMEAMDRLTPERLEERSSLLDGAALIIADANLSEASIRWLAERYPKGRGGPLLGFDPVSAAKAPRGSGSLGAFAFAKPNQAEAAILAGHEPGPLSPAELSRALRARGLGEAFVSLGPEGIWAEGPGPSGRGESWKAWRRSAQDGWAAVNSSGAGDAACAAIAWGILQGRGLGERCVLALAAALLASASESPVNPALCPSLLDEAAKGIECERIS
jgi:pseudouridine kinase